MTRSARTAAEATLTSKGQLTIPARVREAMGVKSGDKLHFVPADADGYLVTPVRRTELLDLAGAFAEAGRRSGDLTIGVMRQRVARGREKLSKARR